MRIVLAGDLHIGRSSAGADGVISHESLRASTCWTRIVQLAIDERADIVCLSGDVADKENQFWEAIGPLESGVRRLSAEGIQTIAVAGNHDFHVFRRLADQLPEKDFRLLGRSGTWERHTVVRDGRPVLHIDGWSFTREAVTQSPLLMYDLPSDATAPVLGLVHGDLDVADSSYAPLDRSRMQALPPAGWLLGHVHVPQLTGDAPWILYAGSPQALDFGERGAHGVWVVDVDHVLGRPEFRPLSTVRYDVLDIDVTGAEAVSDVETVILEHLRSAASSMVAESGRHLEYLVLRVALIGRTRLAHRMHEITSGLREDLSLRVDGVRVDVSRLDIATLPDVDIEAYAEDHSAPGAIARLLLLLDRQDVPGDVAELIASTMRELEDNRDHSYYAMLDRPSISEDYARELLRREGRALLAQLIAQTP